MASTNTPTNESVIPLEQLAEHDTLDTLWIAVYRRVYNFTNFVSSLLRAALESMVQRHMNMPATVKTTWTKCSNTTLATCREVPNMLPSPVGTKKRIRSAASSQPSTPRMKSAATIVALSFVGVALCYRYIPSTQDAPQPTTSLRQKPRYTLWAGAGVASSIGLVAFRYLYVLFLSSLDFQNDVFSFLPKIPRKRR